MSANHADQADAAPVIFEKRGRVAYIDFSMRELFVSPTLSTSRAS